MRDPLDGLLDSVSSGWVMCVRVRQRERECVCACAVLFGLSQGVLSVRGMTERERERESACERGTERENEREQERESRRARTHS